jgi:hypothetical protein
MPFATGNVIVSTFGRQIFVVVGTYTVPGLVGAFRAQSLGKPSVWTIVQNADVDLSLTWFILLGLAPPPGAPPPGSRVRVEASPLAYFAGAPVTTFPVTQRSIEGVVFGYVFLPAFPGIPTSVIIVEPDDNLFLAQIDELTLLDGAT